MRNTEQKIKSYELIDEELAYVIWIAEKEFNIGSVNEDYPVMKLWNLIDKNHIERYRKETSGKGNGQNVLPITMGK